MRYARSVKRNRVFGSGKCILGYARTAVRAISETEPRFRVGEILGYARITTQARSETKPLSRANDRVCNEARKPRKGNPHQAEERKPPHHAKEIHRMIHLKLRYETSLSNMIHPSKSYRNTLSHANFDTEPLSRANKFRPMILANCDTCKVSCDGASLGQ